MNKTIVLLSGGIDSCVLLSLVKHTGRKPTAISFLYGQKHKIELERARQICVELNIEHLIIDISTVGKSIDSALTSDKMIVPHGHYAHDSMKQTVVPNRNMIFLSIAGGIALSKKADSIAIATHAGDHTIYPDCREEFLESCMRTIRIGNWDSADLLLLRPFVELSKADIVKIGKDVGAPMHLSYSCYEGDEIHCGECGTCVERKEAFVNAGIEDKTEYKK